MKKRAVIAPMWTLIAVPALIFVMGTIADIALNSAITGPYVERFLPEICGLTVGALTVLTFARRRKAFLAAGAIFVLTQMIVITLDLPLGARGDQRGRAPDRRALRRGLHLRPVGDARRRVGAPAVALIAARSNDTLSQWRWRPPPGRFTNRPDGGFSSTTVMRRTV